MDPARLTRTVGVPRLARIGARAVRELADDAVWLGIDRVAVVWSSGLPREVGQKVREALSAARVPIAAEGEVVAGSVVEVDGFCTEWGSAGANGVIAVGGGRALDVGKAVAARLRVAGTEGAEPGVPVVCVPTSLSHDGFASPSSSLVDGTGKRVSVRSPGPAGIVVDTTLVATAPRELTLAGIGDVMAKVTALADWRLAEHAGQGERVDGVAAAIAEAAIAEVKGAAFCAEHLSQGGVSQDSAERLARALLLGGVAMAVAGSSRPCSGSEHLISHALDRLRSPAGSHGLQVGLAAWVIAHLQGEGQAEVLHAFFEQVGFWHAVRRETRRGLTRDLLIRAIGHAPTIRPGYTTVLSRPGAVELASEVVDGADWLWR